MHLPWVVVTVFMNFGCKDIIKYSIFKQLVNGQTLQICLHIWKLKSVTLKIHWNWKRKKIDDCRTGSKFLGRRYCRPDQPSLVRHDSLMKYLFTIFHFLNWGVTKCLIYGLSEVRLQAEISEFNIDIIRCVSISYFQVQNEW